MYVNFSETIISMWILLCFTISGNSFKPEDLTNIVIATTGDKSLVLTSFELLKLKHPNRTVIP